jgi:tetratricopeptide (TPR) repeat protein
MAMAAKPFDTGPNVGQGQAPKLRVFVSYSRRDIAFADVLVLALEARGVEVIIDRRDLPLLEEWQKELLGFIRKADAVVYVASPSSISSKWCNWEIDQVTTLNKRLAPVVCATLDPHVAVPDSIGRINFLFFTPPNDFDEQADKLVKALGTDLGWLKEHTRLGELARRWDERARPNRLLLPSGDIEEAERWAITRPREAPSPTALHATYVQASRQAATRRQRMAIGGALTVALVAAGLAGFALFERRLAVINEQVANVQRDRAQRALDQVTANASRRVVSLSERQLEQKRQQEEINRIPAPPAVNLESTTSAETDLARGTEFIDLSTSMLAKQDAAAALKAAENAVVILTPPSKLPSLDDAWLIARSKAFEKRALANERLGRREQALKDISESVTVVEPLATQTPDKVAAREHLAGVVLTKGDINAKLNAFDAADADYRRAIDMRTALAAAPDQARLQGAATLKLANLHLGRSKYDDALAATQSSIGLLERLSATGTPSALLQRDLSVAYSLMADILRRTSKSADALPWLDKDLALATKLAASAPDNLLWQHDLEISHDKQGLVLMGLGRLEDAHSAYTKAIAVGEALSKRERKRPQWQRDLAATLVRDGDVLIALKRADQAVVPFRRALAIREELASTQEDPFWQRELEDAYRHTRSILLKNGRVMEAYETAEQQLLATSFAADSDADKPERVARALGSLGWTSLFAQNVPRAVWAGQTAVELKPDLGFAKLNYAHALMYAGETAAATKIYVDGARGTDKNSAQWRQNIRDDFAELRAAKLEHPVMTTIEQAIGK